MLEDVRVKASLCLIASLNILQYMDIMTKLGIQNDTLEDTMAYTIFTLKVQTSGWAFRYCLCCSVVYQSMRIGRKLMKAGQSQTFASMKQTVL